MPEFVQNLLSNVIGAALKVLIAVIILIVGWIIIGRIAKKVGKSSKLQKHDPTLASFVQSGINIGGKLLLVVICITIAGIPGTTIAALIAAIGVGIGLALQGGLSNMAGGIILLIFRPISVGDFISSNGVDGVVTDINIFYTTVLTIDNRRAYLPNGALANSVLINVTAEDKRRIDLTYVITFDSDLEKAKKVLKLVANSDSRILKDPATAVVVLNYGDGAYEVTLRTWCKTEDYWDAYFAIQDKVQPAFEASGIKLGHPHLNVHIDDTREK